MPERFELEWDHPSLPDAATHVSLFDGGKSPLNIVASGHGVGELQALSDLIATLTERREPPDVIAFVADEYQARTGRPPQLAAGSKR
jgi:hypothetical protein